MQNKPHSMGLAGKSRLVFLDRNFAFACKNPEADCLRPCLAALHKFCIRRPGLQKKLPHQLKWRNNCGKTQRRGIMLKAWRVHLTMLALFLCPALPEKSVAVYAR